MNHPQHLEGMANHPQFGGLATQKKGIHVIT